MKSIEVYIHKAIEMIMEYGPKFILAIITLFIGLKVISFSAKIAAKAFDKAGMDKSLRPFLNSILTWTFKILLFISIASMLGIETTSFVAVIGAAGLAVGLALQGTLANFAGGVLILVFRPYKIGDWVESDGHFGQIEEIQIFVTIMISLENKTIIVPNAMMSNGSLVNYSTKGEIMIDLTIGVSYDADIKKARKVMVDAMLSDPNVLRTPAPTASVRELADSSVNFAVRPWCHPDLYWDVYFKTLEECKIALDEAKITIPFPQTDVHLFKEKK